MRQGRRWTNREHNVKSVNKRNQSININHHIYEITTIELTTHEFETGKDNVT